MPFRNLGLLRPAIAALAGRRIDPPQANETHFPPAEVEYVATKLSYRFRSEHVKRLVCSAACGADILALEAAEKLAIQTTLVLPFAPHIFREISVTDRPGNWGIRFDRLITAAQYRNDVVVLGLDPNDDSAFALVNDRIIQLANTMSFKRQLAFVVWEGKSHAHNDITADFLKKAIALGFEKRTVLTMRRKH